MSSAAVVDSSVVLAVLHGEPLGGFDPLSLDGASISAVNIAEIYAKALEGGVPIEETGRALARLNLVVMPFDEARAAETARLRPATRALGLSLGDRACIALGIELGLPVYTADRAWAAVAVSQPIHVVR